MIQLGNRAEIPFEAFADIRASQAQVFKKFVCVVQRVTDCQMALVQDTVAIPVKNVVDVGDGRHDLFSS